MHHICAGPSRRNRKSDLLTRGHQIFLQQVRIVRFNDCYAGVPEDLRQLVDVAGGMEPARAERVAQHVRRDRPNLRARRPRRLTVLCATCAHCADGAVIEPGQPGVSQQRTGYATPTRGRQMPVHENLSGQCR